VEAQQVDTQRMPYAYQQEQQSLQPAAAHVTQPRLRALAKQTTQQCDKTRMGARHPFYHRRSQKYKMIDLIHSAAYKQPNQWVAHCFAIQQQLVDVQKTKPPVTSHKLRE
jgi:hypothetical protein